MSEYVYFTERNTHIITIKIIPLLLFYILYAARAPAIPPHATSVTKACTPQRSLAVALLRCHHAVTELSHPSLPLPLPLPPPHRYTPPLSLHTNPSASHAPRFQNNRVSSAMFVLISLEFAAKPQYPHCSAVLPESERKISSLKLVTHY